MATGNLPFKSFPGEFGDNNLTSTGLAASLFGINASAVRIENLGGGPAYIRLRSTGPATTGDHRLSTGQVLEVRHIGVQISGFAWAATSTGVVLNAGAWG